MRNLFLGYEHNLEELFRNYETRETKSTRSTENQPLESSVSPIRRKKSKDYKEKEKEKEKESIVESKIATKSQEIIEDDKPKKPEVRHNH